MIGNDIVDLKMACLQSNWQRKGFLNKIFTVSEQTVIHESQNPFNTVWLLWSMKESAYKVNVQQYSKLFFAPNKLECILQSATEGIVKYNNEHYITTSIITNAYIFTTATLKKEKSIYNNCFKVKNVEEKMQSKQTYDKLKQMVSKKYAFDFKSATIKKNDSGVPKLYFNNSLLKIPISITPHGGSGAVSIIENH